MQYKVIFCVKVDDRLVEAVVYVEAEMSDIAIIKAVLDYDRDERGPLDLMGAHFVQVIPQ